VVAPGQPEILGFFELHLESPPPSWTTTPSPFEIALSRIDSDPHIQRAVIRNHSGRTIVLSNQLTLGREVRIYNEQGATIALDERARIELTDDALPEFDADTRPRDPPSLQRESQEGLSWIENMGLVVVRHNTTLAAEFVQHESGRLVIQAQQQLTLVGGATFLGTVQLHSRDVILWFASRVSTPPRRYVFYDTQIDGDGKVIFSGDELIIRRPVTIPVLDIAGGVVKEERITIGKQLNWTRGRIVNDQIVLQKTAIGTFGYQSGWTASLFLDKGTIRNDGTLNYHRATLHLDNGTIIDNRGLFDIFGDAASKVRVVDGKMAEFQNRGIVRKLTGGGVTELLVPFTITDGKVIQKSGTLKIPNITPITGQIQIDPAILEIDGLLAIPAGFVVSGTGDIIADIRNGGEVDPGEIGYAGYLHFVGAYSQAATTISGILNSDIGGTDPGQQYDQIRIDESALLDGTLTISLINGFTPTLNQSFVILTAASVYGSFTTVNGLQYAGPSGPYRFAVQYNPTNVTLTVVYNTTLSPPTVSGVSPSSGSTAGGETVLITGTNFTDVTNVSFGGIPALAFTVNSATQITATTPASAPGVHDIQVTTVGGTSPITPADQFTYIAAPAPAITQITPSSGSTAGGSVVTVVGSNFTGSSSVSFGTVVLDPLEFTVLSDTALVALSPPQPAGTVDIRVTTPSGTSPIVTADRFTYVAPSVPAVTGVSPSSGTTAGGTVVTITGSNFTEGNRSPGSGAQLRACRVPMMTSWRR
jgi:hypothetical protein